jgi:hypothetical protein
MENKAHFSKPVPTVIECPEFLRHHLRAGCRPLRLSSTGTSRASLIAEGSLRPKSVSSLANILLRKSAAKGGSNRLGARDTLQYDRAHITGPGLSFVLRWAESYCGCFPYDSNDTCHPRILNQWCARSDAWTPRVGVCTDRARVSRNLISCSELSSKYVEVVKPTFAVCGVRLQRL